MVELTSNTPAMDRRLWVEREKVLHFSLSLFSAGWYKMEPDRVLRNNLWIYKDGHAGNSGRYVSWLLVQVDSGTVAIRVREQRRLIATRRVSSTTDCSRLFAWAKAIWTFQSLVPIGTGCLESYVRDKTRGRWWMLDATGGKEAPVRKRTAT